MQDQLLSHLYLEVDKNESKNASGENDDRGERDEVMDVRGRRIGELKGEFGPGVTGLEKSC